MQSREKVTSTSKSLSIFWFDYTITLRVRRVIRLEERWSGRRRISLAAGKIKIDFGFGTVWWLAKEGERGREWGKEGRWELCYVCALPPVLANKRPFRATRWTNAAELASASEWIFMGNREMTEYIPRLCSFLTADLASCLQNLRQRFDVP